MQAVCCCRVPVATAGRGSRAAGCHHHDRLTLDQASKGADSAEVSAAGMGTSSHDLTGRAAYFIAALRVTSSRIHGPRLRLSRALCRFSRQPPCVFMRAGRRGTPTGPDAGAERVPDRLTRPSIAGWASRLTRHTLAPGVPVGVVLASAQAGTLGRHDRDNSQGHEDKGQDYQEDGQPHDHRGELVRRCPEGFQLCS